MPKIVDHDHRRTELVQAALRIVVRSGLSGATMRDIAHEAGFANGAIKPYFQTKADLLLATYEHIYRATNARMRARTRGKRGLAALEGFAEEVLPVNPALHEEAIVFLAFLGEAAQNPEHLQVSRNSMEEWRTWIRDWLAEAIDDGEVAAGLDVDIHADLLLTLAIGAQPMSILDRQRFTFENLRRMVHRHLDWLRGERDA